MNPIDEERARLADTLVLVGPDAPTNAGAWTAHDVAAHVLSIEGSARYTTFVGRSIVARGIRLNDRVPQAVADLGIARMKRRGFDWAVARLRMPSPSVLARPSVRAVTLFEVWAHHEDVRRPNGLSRDTHPDLSEVIAWLRRYGDIDDVPEGPPHEVAYWLAGRVGGPRPI